MEDRRGRYHCPYKAASAWRLDTPIAEEREADVRGPEMGSDLRHPSDRSS